jgi:predicted TIM-barrel fold metal-dependent hydrolase
MTATEPAPSPPYAGSRHIHDADAHVIETPYWLLPFADPDVRERLGPLPMSNAPGPDSDAWTRLDAAHDDAATRAAAANEVLLHKNWQALGSYRREDRPAALDRLGFASQLVFNTWTSAELVRAEQRGDGELLFGLARAHNRAIVDFCSVDRRLFAVGYVPLGDLERAVSFAAEAIELGCDALMVASVCPPTHGPSHVALEPVWAQAAEAGIPVVLHVGGGGQLLDPNYLVNGLPKVPDFHGGDGNFTSVDYLAIPTPVMQTLACWVIDGVLDRHPDLRVGVIEQGASWLPGFLRNLDSAHEAFSKNEPRLQRLAMKPSEYVRRQVRVTPYPHEDAGWIVTQAGPELCLFSSDYPHIEGGRNPLGRFDRSLDAHDVPEAARQRFFWANFEDLMGRRLREKLG